MAATNTTTGTGGRKPPTMAPPSRVPAPAPRAPQMEGGLVGGITRWFREVRSELRKVVWPSRDDVKNLTAIVIVVSLAVGTFLGVVDALFEQLFRLILQR